MITYSDIADCDCACCCRCTYPCDCVINCDCGCHYYRRKRFVDCHPSCDCRSCYDDGVNRYDPDFVWDDEGDCFVLEDKEDGFVLDDEEDGSKFDMRPDGLYASDRDTNDVITRHHISAWFDVFEDKSADGSTKIYISASHEVETEDIERVYLPDGVLNDPIKLAGVLDKRRLNIVPELFSFLAISGYVKERCEFKGIGVFMSGTRYSTLQKKHTVSYPTLDETITSVRNNVVQYFRDNVPSRFVGRKDCDACLLVDLCDYKMLSSYYGKFFLVDEKFFEKTFCNRIDAKTILALLEESGYVISHFGGQLWFKDRLNPNDPPGIDQPGFYAIRYSIAKRRYFIAPSQ